MPLRSYAALDSVVGRDICVLVKHENHQPTNCFKVRNGLAAVTALPAEQRRCGIVCGSRGNHGLGVAYAGARLGAPVTVVVPFDNNPEKNEAIRGLGAALVEHGDDYDAAVTEAERLSRERGLTLIHSTNNRDVIAGAATMVLEVLEQADRLDAVVVAIGGGSQAVGAIAVLAALRPEVRVYGVQAEGASAIFEAWRAGRPIAHREATTFADGIATRSTYELTFEAMREGLAGFVTVSESEIADGVRLLLRTTHNLAEGAGAAGLAGLLRLRDELTSQAVAVILSGGNIDIRTLALVLCGGL